MPRGKRKVAEPKPLPALEADSDVKDEEEEAEATEDTDVDVDGEEEEPPLKKAREDPDAGQMVVRHDTLVGKMPVRQAPWQRPVSDEAIAKIHLGKEVVWGFNGNQFVCEVGNNPLVFDCPPGLVIASWMSGLGRVQMNKPSGFENKHQVDVQFGNLPESVKAKNPGLEIAHQVFIAGMMKVMAIAHRSMYDSGIAAETKDTQVGLMTSAKEREHFQWPEKKSLLTKEVLAEVMMKKFNELSEDEANEKIDASGLLEPGGARPEHDEEVRAQITGISKVKKLEQIAFDKEVHDNAFIGWLPAVRNPLKFDDAYPERMTMSFSNNVMFIPKKKSTVPKAVVARQEMATEELQHYMDHVGPWGTHTPFEIQYYSPPSAGQPQKRIYEAETKEDPFFEAINPGDLISLKFKTRAYFPTSGAGIPGVKFDPEFKPVFIHHVGNTEETADIVPHAIAAGFDYGMSSGTF